MNKKTITTILCAVGSAFIIFAFLIACVETFAFNNNFYKSEYAKLNTARVVGVSENVLNDATDKLLDYLKDKEVNLDMSVEGKEYYNQREKDHMVDVKVLYENAKTFMYMGFIIGGLLLLINFIWQKKEGIKTFVNSFFNTGLIIMGFFVLIALYAVVDFSSFWVNFHLLFFTNDLWILDPSTSLLIRMYEQTFFFDLVGYILIMFFAVFGSAMVVCGITKRKLKNARY